MCPTLRRKKKNKPAAALPSDSVELLLSVLIFHLNVLEQSEIGNGQEGESFETMIKLPGSLKPLSHSCFIWKLAHCGCVQTSPGSTVAGLSERLGVSPQRPPLDDQLRKHLKTAQTHMASNGEIAKQEELEQTEA